MEYSEDDLLPISGLQHLASCERQCALIHVEQTWEENRLTAEGRLLHERTHEAGEESRGDTRIARAVALRSLELGLTGVADVVEFRRVEEASCQSSPHPGMSLPGVKGLWVPFPVEYRPLRKFDDGGMREAHVDHAFHSRLTQTRFSG
ncbi:MAG: Dna2/Cas4 domain-containing protein [Candidatus Riflebacteria bacterium]|nr:Dna2/Cas4 domain-containing protein [Candidatus Riflebacteria bacterium]